MLLRLVGVCRGLSEVPNEKLCNTKEFEILEEDEILTKGKPWPVEDERKLKDWFTSGITDLRVLAFSFDGEYSEEAIRQKLIKFGLFREEQQQSRVAPGCCSSLELPKELPSVEETLKTLSAALKALEKSGLKRDEVVRLRGIILGAKTYKELLADYMNYRALEEELLVWRNKYEALAKKFQ